MTAPVEVPERTTTEVPDLLHIVCVCQQEPQKTTPPRLALCDTDTTEDTTWNGEPIQPCVVCRDFVINKLPCRYCGFKIP
jgi:hypothetical protein